MKTFKTIRDYIIAVLGLLLIGYIIWYFFFYHEVKQFVPPTKAEIKLFKQMDKDNVSNSNENSQCYLGQCW